MKKYILFSCVILLLGSCVTKVINSDGSLQDSSTNKNKLAEVYTNLAIEYQLNGATSLALERVNLALSYNSNYAKAYAVRAMIYQQLLKNELANDDFEEAISLDKNNLDTKVNYAVFLCAQKNYKQAYKNFDLALNDSFYQTPAVAEYNKANCLVSESNYAIANELYLKATQDKNVAQSAYLALAKLKYQESQFELAKYYIDKYKLNATAEVLMLQINILDKLGKDKNQAQIRKLVDSLLRKYPNSIQAQECVIKYN